MNQLHVHQNCDRDYSLSVILLFVVSIDAAKIRPDTLRSNLCFRAIDHYDPLRPKHNCLNSL